MADSHEQSYTDRVEGVIAILQVTYRQRRPYHEAVSFYRQVGLGLLDQADMTAYSSAAASDAVLTETQDRLYEHLRDINLAEERRLDRISNAAGLALMHVETPADFIRECDDAHAGIGQALNDCSITDRPAAGENGFNSGASQ